MNTNEEKIQAPVYLTKEGYEKIKKEIHKLKTEERPLIAKQIAEARDKGDLSENAEYHAAREAQGLLELKISKLEEQISNFRILDTSQIDTSKVGVLSTIKIKNLDTSKEMTYTLVPENESNVKEGKISISTPIAKGLLNKKKNEIVKIEVPSGIMNFQILSITYNI